MKQKQVEQTEVEERINKENEALGFLPGLYHHLIISDGSRSIELSTPADRLDFDSVLDMGMYLMLFTQNEDMRKNMKSEFIKHWNKKDKPVRSEVGS